MDTGFVRHESPHNGTFDMLRRPADARLRPVAPEYAGFIDSTPGAFSRRELPFPGAVFVISFGGPYTVANGRTGEATATSSFIAGMHDTFVTNTQAGPTAGVQVNFTPLGAFFLLQRPMHEVANRTIALDELLGAEGRSWTARLAEAPGWEARFNMLDDLLLARFAHARPASRGVAWAWRKLQATGGRVPIGSLAADLGWSRKHLITKFREQIGLPPKTAARVLRFNNAVRLIERGAELPWTEIAIRSGYYDQAHFIRDFNQFAGATPTEFVASRNAGGGIDR
jgi:AraC-like DNA-binding protein